MKPPQLDDRAQQLLHTLVARYIQDGQPVGSRTLSRALAASEGPDLSAATIRNVMADLEALGLIASPHTSAGRVPTPRAYRVFVDAMLTVKRVEVQQTLATHSTNTATLQPASTLISPTPQKIITQAAHTLSHLSQFVGVVLAPKQDAVFKHIEFLRLSQQRLLVILVAPSGEVHNRVMHPPQDYSASVLLETSNYLNAHYSGLSIAQIQQRLQTELERLRTEIASLMQSTLAVGGDVQSAQDAVVIAGEHNLLAVGDFSADLAQLRRAFDLFTQKAQLVQLLDGSSKAEGIKIYIGGESAHLMAQELSVVSAPYSVDGQVVGRLGVIGPTRMPYDKVIEIVDITSKLVGSALSEAA